MTTTDYTRLLVGEIIAKNHGGGFEVMSELGDGSFGAVYHCRRKVKSGFNAGLIMDYAVKCPLLKMDVDDEKRERAKKKADDMLELELEILTILGSLPFITCVTDYYVDEGVPLLFMRYAEGNALSRWMQRDNAAGFDLLYFRDELLDDEPYVLRALDIALQVGHGIDLLFHNGVLHCDLKPSNVLVFSTMPVSFDESRIPHMEFLNVRLCDFGLAELTNERFAEIERQQSEASFPSLVAQHQRKLTSARRGMKGTKGYQLAQYDPNCPDCKYDVYSLGILLLEMMCKGKWFSLNSDVDDGIKYLNDWIESTENSSWKEVLIRVLEVIARSTTIDVESRYSTTEFVAGVQNALKSFDKWEGLHRCVTHAREIETSTTFRESNRFVLRF